MSTLIPPNLGRLQCAIVASLCLAGSSLLIGQTTYTWTQYDNAIAGATTIESWNDAANWDINGIFSSGINNTLVFFANTTTSLEEEGVLVINGVPSSLSMGTLTLNGRGPNNTFGTAINIGDNSSTWTIGNGTTGTINLNATNGGGSTVIDGKITQDRFANFTVNPNITLAQTTSFTGNGAGKEGFNFTGNITDGGSGYGITKSGNSRLVLSGTNTYTGATTVNGGLLRLNSAGALPTNSALILNNAYLELAHGDFTRNLGTGNNEFRMTGGSAGFSAQGGARTITINNDASQEVVWGSADFNPSTLNLNSNTADSAITLTNNLDLGSSTRTINVTTNQATLSGDIRNSSGTAGITKNGVGTLHLTGANTYNGNTTINSGTLSIETSDNAGVGGSIVLNGGTLGIRGTSLSSLSSLGHSVTIGANKTVGFDISDSSHLFGADIALTQGTGGLIKLGRGSLVLDQTNTFTGSTTASGGGNLILDYSSNDNSKLSDSNSLTLGGTTLTLSGGSHAEVVSATSITDRTANIITRDSGSATINLNNISRGGRSTLHITEAGIASTDTTNLSQGILGAWATVGSHWAINQTNGTDGAIVAYSGYTALPTNGGLSNSTNYELQGGATLTAGGDVFTLRIQGTANDQVLDMGGNRIRTIPLSNGGGGILYAGGANDNYTITNGDFEPTNGNGQTLLINTYAGKLNMDATLTYGSSGLSKTGEGVLALGGANSYSGQSDVLQGGLLVDGSTTSSPFVVNAGARIGGSGTIGGDLTLALGADFIFNPTDPLIVSGLVSLDDTFGLDNLVNEDGSGINWGLVSDGTYTLIDNAGDYSNIENFGLTNAGDIGGGRTAYFQNGSLQLVVIPEPSSLLLCALSGLLLVRRRR